MNINRIRFCKENLYCYYTFRDRKARGYDERMNSIFKKSVLRRHQSLCCSRDDGWVEEIELDGALEKHSCTCQIKPKHNLLHKHCHQHSASPVQNIHLFSFKLENLFSIVWHYLRERLVKNNNSATPTLSTLIFDNVQKEQDILRIPWG